MVFGTPFFCAGHLAQDSIAGSDICAYKRGLGRFNGTKGGKRSGNERNGSTDQPPKSHKRLLRLLKKIYHKLMKNWCRTIGKKRKVGKIPLGNALSYDNCYICLLTHCVGGVE